MGICPALRDRLASPPRSLGLGLGALSVALGTVVAVWPIASVGTIAVLVGGGMAVAGLSELLSDTWLRRGSSSHSRRWRTALALNWLTVGGLVALWPGLTVRLIALGVGVGLLVDGLLQLADACTSSMSSDRRVSVLLGTTWLILALHALLRRDIPLAAAALGFASRLISIGLLTSWRFMAPKTEDRTTWAHTVRTAAALVVALSIALLGTAHRSSPVAEDFYAPPRDVPAQPGKLIRWESFTREVPDGSDGWRILYTTTRADGSPTVASGLVVAPRGGNGAWPVVGWAHSTTGIAEQCAPSLLPAPFTSGDLFLLPEMTENGWAVVATDYIGLGTAGPHPYLVGVPSAHAVLDAIRAARHLTDARLGERTVVWGHSQGGAAALWVGAIASRYAPDVPLTGIAALSPASNLPALIDNLANVQGGSVFASYLFAAYAHQYPDVHYGTYIRPEAEGIIGQLSERCLANSTSSTLSLPQDVFARSPTEGALGLHLAANIPPATLATPLLIAQGTTDTIVPLTSQDAYVESTCRADQRVDYRIYPERGHLDLVTPQSALIPELFAWTLSRFDGMPIAKGCTRSTR